MHERLARSQISAEERARAEVAALQRQLADKEAVWLHRILNCAKQPGAHATCFVQALTRAQYAAESKIQQVSDLTAALNDKVTVASSPTPPSSTPSNSPHPPPPSPTVCYRLAR